MSSLRRRLALRVVAMFLCVSRCVCVCVGGGSLAREKREVLLVLEGWCLYVCGSMYVARGWVCLLLL